MLTYCQLPYINVCPTILKIVQYYIIKSKICASIIKSIGFYSRFRNYLDTQHRCGKDTAPTGVLKVCIYFWNLL